VNYRLKRQKQNKEWRVEMKLNLVLARVITLALATGMQSVQAVGEWKMLMIELSTFQSLPQ
jgi:hypothetical protein